MGEISNSTEVARQIRELSIDMVYKAKASHVGGALSMADILAVLYHEILNVYPQIPKHPSRDRFLLSKGHSCVGLYAILAIKEFFPMAELDTYTKDGSFFSSHSTHHVPGIEISAGSLGHGLPISVGMAIAAKRRGESWKTYCLLSDGELNEGSNWEAIMLAAHLKLNNLVAIIDYNKIQSLGFVEDVIALEPLGAKFTTFGWDCLEVDGHNHSQLLEALKQKSTSKPLAIIAHTIKGKGVDFMENKLLWHYKSPDKEQYTEAKLQLKKTL